MSGKNSKKLRKLVNQQYESDIAEFSKQFDKLLNGLPILYRAKYAWKVLLGKIGN